MQNLNMLPYNVLVPDYSKSIIYDVGLYLRLSRDDRNGKAESMSIENQKKLLTNFAKEKGWKIREIYIDDGYTGTNFNRPGFERMIEDIERGKINMVITKDLSRLGRNYVMLGHYTDFYFPTHNVRFIAINDDFDTVCGDNEIAPFKNILNEMYAKDISKKIRSVRHMSAQEGKFMGSVPPYGYLKNPDNKHQLIVDEEVRPVIEEVFQRYVQGESMRQIAMNLTDRGIPSPKAYYYKRIGKKNPKNESPTWADATVRQLLQNQVYIGNMVQGTRLSPSFKIKKRVAIPKDQWLVVENTHEAIVSKDIWDEVHKRLKKKGKTRSRISKTTGELSLFAGTLLCADCGSKLAFTTKKNVNSIVKRYRCTRYNEHGKNVCSHHMIREEVLVDVVLGDIRTHANLALKSEKALYSRILNLLTAEKCRSDKTLKNDIAAAESRLVTIDQLMDVLLQERSAGNLTDTVFKRKMAGYEQEQTDLECVVATLKEQLAKQDQTEKDIAKWLKEIKKYSDLTELDRNVITGLIESIIVSEKYTENEEWYQDITINYKYVGCVVEDTSKTKLSA